MIIDRQHCLHDKIPAKTIPRPWDQLLTQGMSKISKKLRPDYKLKDVISIKLMSEEFDCKVTVRKNPDWKMYIAECITGGQI